MEPTLGRGLSAKPFIVMDQIIRIQVECLIDESLKISAKGIVMIAG